MVDRKKTRERIGYTAAAQKSNPAVWLWLAQGYRAAAEVLHESRERIPNNTRPFALNAGYSLELLFKCLIAQKGSVPPEGPTGHDLPHLSAQAGLNLSRDQLTTLENFKETIVWLGRYPSPKKDEAWDNYHDNILEKSVLREMTSIGGKIVGTVRADPATFANWENYLRIWNAAFELIDPQLKTKQA